MSGSGQAAVFSGTSWSGATIIGAGRPLSSVSCASSSFCVAIDSEGGALEFNGTAWLGLASVVAAARVSCVSSTFCMAVTDTSASVFNGHSWSAPTRIANLIESVSCASSTFCVAVGLGQGLTFNGQSWGAPVPINTAGDVDAVSCPTQSFCAAVSTGGAVTTYNGATWGAPKLIGPSLDAISCTSATFCVAVGGAVVAYDGVSWTARSGGSGGQLFAVSCGSPSLCVAVDYFRQLAIGLYPGSSQSWPLGGAGGLVSCGSPTACELVDSRGRAMSYRSGSWSAPTLLGGTPAPSAVSCATASFCVAVAGSDALTFDGSSWSARAKVDNIGSLTSVSCASPTFCAAVDATETVGQALTFNGTSWQTQDINDGASADSVSCPTTSFCAAVDARGEALTYQGGSWSGSVTADPFGATAVSCASSSFCVAVDAGGDAVTYNGSSWSAPTLILPGSPAAVACPSASFCVAVDNGGNASLYDGSSWSFPLNVAGGIALTSVSCPSISFCMALDANGNAIRYGSFPPYALSAPSISGPVSEGFVLTEAHGTWMNKPTAFTYQWLDCNAAGFVCTPIAGATGRRHRLDAADVGHTIRVQETATGTDGISQPSDSSATIVVGAAPPGNISAPAISGTATEGQVLTEMHGAWTNQPTAFSYQWYDCTPAGSCTPIPGATGRQHRVGAADVGRTLRVQETAFNPNGRTPAWSPVTAVVPAEPSLNVSPPSISGAATDGQILTEAHGTWINIPTAFTYQWLDCNPAGAACTPITGATGRQHRLATADVGHTIRVQETAIDGAGSSTPATSAATGTVVSTATPLLQPSNSSPPVISGLPIGGHTLSSSAGAWSGTAPVSYSYQWERCPSSCSAIAGA